MRELALGRLDPAPLQREAVGTQAQVGHQIDVLVPAVPRITGVAARLHATGVGVVLPVPPVVVDVAALDLMGGGGGPPQESRREFAGPFGLSLVAVMARTVARPGPEPHGPNRAIAPRSQRRGAVAPVRVAEEARDVVELVGGARPLELVHRPQQRSVDAQCGQVPEQQRQVHLRRQALGQLGRAAHRAAQARVPVRHRGGDGFDVLVVPEHGRRRLLSPPLAGRGTRPRCHRRAPSQSGIDAGPMP